VRRIALAALAALAFAGCGGDDEKDKAGPTPPGTSTAREGAGKTETSNTSPARTPESGGSPPPGPAARGAKPVGTVPPGGGPVADQRAVVRTVRGYLLSIAAGDGVRACAQLTPKGRRFMERRLARLAPETKGAPCEASILLYQNAYGSAIRNPRVTRVRVTGDRARATGPAKEAAILLKRGRLWRISRYGQ